MEDPQVTIGFYSKIKGHSWLGWSFGGTPMILETSKFPVPNPPKMVPHGTAPPSSFGCSRDTGRSSQQMGPGPGLDGNLATGNPKISRALKIVWLSWYGIPIVTIVTISYSFTHDSHVTWITMVTMGNSLWGPSLGRFSFSNFSWDASVASRCWSLEARHWPPGTEEWHGMTSGTLMT